MSAPSRTTGRYETLDAWRGLACLSVVLFHAVGRYLDASHDGPLCAPLRWADAFGWLGVPLFFTISGLCIAAAATDRAAGVRPREAFFRRRFRRIVPTLWLSLAFAAAIGLTGRALAAAGISNGLWDLTAIGWHWITNVTLLEEPVRLFRVEPQYVNAPTWSLCYEAQFYAFMGLAVVARSRRAVVGAVAALSLASIAMPAWLGATRAGLLTDVGPLFLAGIWVHLRAQAGTASGRRRLDGAWAGVVAGVVAAYAVRTGRLGQDAKQVLICAGFAALLVALRAQDARLAPRPVVRALRAVGRRSYTIYLFHFPVVISLGDTLFTVGATQGARLYAMAAATSATAIALAWVLYPIVERPFSAPPVRSEPGPANSTPSQRNRTIGI